MIDLVFLFTVPLPKSSAQDTECRQKLRGGVCLWIDGLKRFSTPIIDDDDNFETPVGWLVDLAVRRKK